MALDPETNRSEFVTKYRNLFLTKISTKVQLLHMDIASFAEECVEQEAQMNPTFLILFAKLCLYLMSKM